MEVRFRTKKLEKCYFKSQFAVRTWGKEVARRYIQRIDIIQEARDLNELRRIPGLNCHPLTGNREGQYAVSLKGFWRLIFSLHGECLEIVQVEEVSKHYGD